MSRRKQKFPSHIAGDENDCQEHLEKLTASSVDTEVFHCSGTISTQASYISSSKDTIITSIPTTCFYTDMDQQIGSQDPSCRIHQRHPNVEEDFSEDDEGDRSGRLEIDEDPPQASNSVHNVEDAKKDCSAIVTSFSENSANCSENCGKFGEILRKDNKTMRNYSKTKKNNAETSKNCCENLINNISETEKLTKFSRTFGKFSENSPFERRKNNLSGKSKATNSLLPSEATGRKPGRLKYVESVFQCPVCHADFRSKRSFNSHILVHCQLTKAPTINKRNFEESNGFILEKRKCKPSDSIKSEFSSSDLHFPLDLSCKRSSLSVRVDYPTETVSCTSSSLENINHNISSDSRNSSAEDDNSRDFQGNLREDPTKSLDCPENSPESPEAIDNSQESPSKIRDFCEIDENLFNEAREREKAFFGNCKNEMYLAREDSSPQLPSGPPLPMFHSSVTRKVRVSSDKSSSPMIYRIKPYAEQIFVSRILATNEETGDKIELYKCFMCDLSFASVSKLQLHLAHHKQRFVCSKCNYSCDSRIQFSQHVQKNHLIGDPNSSHHPSSQSNCSSSNDSGEDSTNAENTVTVAALLSALHGGRKQFNSENLQTFRKTCIGEDHRTFKSEDRFFRKNYGEDHSFLMKNRCGSVAKKLEKVEQSNQNEKELPLQLEEEEMDAPLLPDLNGGAANLPPELSGGVSLIAEFSGGGKTAKRHPEISGSGSQFPQDLNGTENGLSLQHPELNRLVDLPQQLSESTVHLNTGLNVDGSGGNDMFKMFSCRFCGKKFDRAFSCNRHERVHTGFKPCFCSVCGRGFSEPRNLRHHVIRFHSDGSLRHLIKRDRRKRKSSSDDDDYSPQSPTPIPLSSYTFSSIPPLRPTSSASDDSIPPHRQQQIVHKKSEVMSIPQADGACGTDLQDAPSQSAQASHNGLTKIFDATLDQSSLTNGIVENPSSPEEQPKPAVSRTIGRLLEQLEDETLEPGEIRLNLKARIIDDGDRGRRLVVVEDSTEEGSDHSPQFSSYAPRLNIVQDPVQRNKALTPIIDDIGRTFYECPYCHKLFGSTSDLNRHLDFHEDLRPYECGYCDYSARTNSQLKVHKMRHEGIKQFSCETCNYNGVTQSDLNRHKKTQSHLARSSNVCKMCGLGFYSNSQKQVHIVKCHPEMEGASSLIQMSLGFPASYPVPDAHSDTTSYPVPDVHSDTTSYPDPDVHSDTTSYPDPDAHSDTTSACLSEEVLETDLTLNSR